MSVCCELLKHAWALVAHHSGHRPKVTQEQMAALTLYPSAKRTVRNLPKTNEEKNQ